MTSHDPESPLPERLPALERELHELADAPFRIPESEADTLRAEAHRHVGRFRMRLVTRRAAAAVAAAAAVVVIAVVIGGGPDHQSPLEVPATPVAGDATGDGVLDVRDAYLIDWTLQQGAPAPATGDHDGDGQVEAADARAIMDAIVALEGGR